MTGLLGWMAADRPEPADGIPEKMLAAAGASRAGRSVQSARGASIVAWNGRDAVSTVTFDGVQAAVLGNPRWNESALEKRAREDGLAASLVQGYRAYGPDCLKKLHGAFAVALLDVAAEQGMIAVDRLGIKPLSFAVVPGGFVFASDARAVAAYPSVGSDLDSQAVYEYLFFHMVPSPGTIFQNVEKLLPAQYVTFSTSGVERKFYWHLVYGKDQPGSFDEKAARLKALLADAVGASAAGGEPVGAFLSGGLDSSTVSGFLAKVSGGVVDTFSIGFDAKGFDEMEYARIAARHFGTRPHEYYVTPDDVVAAIPKIAESYDEPFGNASAVPAYFCAKLAHDAGVRVMLAGDGGDEIFGGNARYAKQKVFELYWKLPSWMRSGVIEPVVENLPGAASVPPLRKLQSYVAQARIPLPNRLETYNFLHREPLDQMLSADFMAHLQLGRPEALMREVYQRSDAESFIDRMLHLDLKFTLADNDLRKVNRTAELAGVAVRYPMLDEALVEFSAGLSPDEKVQGQRLRHFFKQALGDFLPGEIISKSKHGFGLPFGLWMESHRPLRDLAYDSLEAFRARGYVQPAYIDKLIQQHRTGHASYYGVMIWVLMMLEQWLSAHSATQR